MGYLLNSEDGYLQTEKAGHLRIFSEEVETAEVFETVDEALDMGFYLKDEFGMKCQIEEEK